MLYINQNSRHDPINSRADHIVSDPIIVSRVNVRYILNQVQLTHPPMPDGTYPDISNVYNGNAKPIRPTWLYERDRNRSTELLNFEYKRNKNVPPLSNIKAICKNRAWGYTDHTSTFITKGIKDTNWFNKREQCHRSNDKRIIIQQIKNTRLARPC